MAQSATSPWITYQHGTFLSKILSKWVVLPKHFKMKYYMVLSRKSSSGKWIPVFFLRVGGELWKPSLCQPYPHLHEIFKVKGRNTLDGSRLNESMVVSIASRMAFQEICLSVVLEPYKGHLLHGFLVWPAGRLESISCIWNSEMQRTLNRLSVECRQAGWNLHWEPFIQSLEPSPSQKMPKCIHSEYLFL